MKSSLFESSFFRESKEGRLPPKKGFSQIFQQFYIFETKEFQHLTHLDLMKLIFQIQIQMINFSKEAKERKKETRKRKKSKIFFLFLSSS